MVGGIWRESEREREKKKTLLKGHAQTVRAEVPLSSYPAIIAAINQFCGAIFSTAIKCAEGPDAYSHPILPLGHCYNSERAPALQTSLDRRTVWHFIIAPWLAEQALQRKTFTTASPSPTVEAPPSIFSSSCAV